MIGDQVELGRFAANARRYAMEQLAWTQVVGAYRANLSAVLTRPERRGSAALGRHLSLHEPALGGAEEYLVETLKRLRPRFERIDLAAVDTQQITNRNHFGCD